MPDDIDEYGYIDELKAYIMETLTWATVSFSERFGRRLVTPFSPHRINNESLRLSKRAKDTIVLEYTCAGLRLGVPPELLTKDYYSLLSFNARLDRLAAEEKYKLTCDVVTDVENSVLRAKKRCITSLLVRAALMVGHDLLPERVKVKYQLRMLDSKWKRYTQKILIALLWLIYPLLLQIPLRGMICLLLVLESSLRPIFHVSVCSHSIYVVL